MWIILFDQYVTVESSHLRNCKHSDRSEGFCSNRKYFSLCNISTKYIVRCTLQSVECDISSISPSTQSISINELTSGDSVTLYFTLKQQENLSSFSQNVRTLLDNLSNVSYPNLSVYVEALCPEGDYSIWLYDRFAMRYSVQEIQQATEIDRYYSEELESEEALTLGSSTENV